MSKPSKKERIIRTCLRKKAYSKMGSAQNAIKKMKLESKLHAYECPACGSWHIGHIVPKPVRMAP